MSAPLAARAAAASGQSGQSGQAAAPAGAVPATGPGAPTGAGASAQASAPAGVTGVARATRPWSLASPWLMGAVLLLAAWLAWFTVDVLQGRLNASSAKFDAGVHRFERFWNLHGAALEATLSLRWDLAAGDAAADGLQADAFRFRERTAALREELAQPDTTLSQAATWDAAAQGLSERLAHGVSAVERPGVQAQVQAVLDDLARVGDEARQRQAMSAAFLAEVQAVRRQVMIAFSVIAGMLVLVVALAAQWMLVARRERAIRGRAEHLAAVAESERARAEAADREKGRFLGMLSHELLTPLQSIWSTIDVVESRGRIEAGDASFRRLKESTRSLRGRISDLLDFAKMSSGRLETRIRGFQLDKLIDTALRDVEEALAERNLDVHWEAGPELGQRIYSDPARLRQVIDNLLTNAIKYTERGGITIVAELRPEQGLLRVEISDTGAGIAPEAMARLFEPFYRSPLTAGMAEGSGLGLAVVRSLVELMGGTIRFDSRQGQGTAVTVEVPITEGAEGLVVDAPPQLDTRLPVLVVDDSRDARRAISEVIRAMGITVVEASDGRSGLAAAAEGEFQAILLDLQMPDLTGLQVAQALRQAGNRHEKTFLALVSAYNDLDDKTLDALFDARVDKPAGRKELAAVLGRAARARA